MALLESVSLPQHAIMPDFSLPTPDGTVITRSEAMGSKGLLVVFTCNHCPYAIAIWERLVTTANEAKGLGINTVAINPNIHPDYPEDAPEKMTQKIKEWKITFPYLVDAAQKTARDYDAVCTPDLYLLNTNAQLVYHGRLDDNWKEPTKVSHRDLWVAIQNLSCEKEINTNQKPSMGCSIKWKD